jgi:hypothetical protein
MILPIAAIVKDSSTGHFGKFEDGGASGQSMKPAPTQALRERPDR